MSSIFLEERIPCPTLSPTICPAARVLARPSTADARRSLPAVFCLPAIGELQRRQGRAGCTCVYLPPAYPARLSNCLATRTALVSILPAVKKTAPDLQGSLCQVEQQRRACTCSLSVARHISSVSRPRCLRRWIRIREQTLVGSTCSLLFSVRSSAPLYLRQGTEAARSQRHLERDAFQIWAAHCCRHALPFCS
jgi:hypothetical protein